MPREKFSDERRATFLKDLEEDAAHWDKLIAEAEWPGSTSAGCISLPAKNKNDELKNGDVVEK